MKRVCAWCKTEMGETDSKTVSKAAITHGICLSCMKKVAEKNALPQEEYLDRLGVPILLVEPDVKVRIANKQAREILGKDQEQIAGKRPGNVIECVHAREQGGCGRQVHCRSCVIRRTVEETFATGESFVRVPACADIEQFDKQQNICCEISTEKVGDIVFLRIDSVKKA